MKKYYITNETAVDGNTITEITDNNETGDQKCTLNVANNAENDGSRIVFINTNGDPIYVGSLGDGFWFDVTNDADIIDMLDIEFDKTLDDLESL